MRNPARPSKLRAARPGACGPSHSTRVRGEPVRPWHAARSPCARRAPGMPSCLAAPRPSAPSGRGLGLRVRRGRWGAGAPRRRSRPLIPSGRPRAPGVRTSSAFHKFIIRNDLRQLSDRWVSQPAGSWATAVQSSTAAPSRNRDAPRGPPRPAGVPPGSLRDARAHRPPPSDRAADGSGAVTQGVGF